ncbi:alpha-galactosidase [Paenibacillus radicis (ex Gao et al. 2016)]|uniref:Alpha-galactosidase n=1 Tax=Paenibacillus radicis (ex Gao et al. 2016) TaxID=1737354 RepID=A0A917HKY2_9BACL|nr:alpha-galactosidase [Paenibacillus radicis (ex Gao et al. 2016)]GGG81545.1 alpha-galactosidase [Paenibacillus radicis (ex Gao et al. 2016)]
MGIQFDEQKQIFHLQSRETSYVIKIVKGGYPAHLYWGRRVRGSRLERLLELKERSSFSPTTDPEFSLDTLPHEYPAFGNSDFRSPAYQVQLTNGTTVSDLRYESHEIRKGKPQLAGLPSVYTESDEEAETLEITLKDALSGLTVVLTYTVFENYNAITRSARLINNGSAELKVLRALSMSLDFANDEYEMLQLSGAWARERYIHRRKLVPGMQSIESRRGSSSSMQNPFIALLGEGADEDHGEVYGVNLVYSGSFTAGVEVSQFHTSRLFMGINPFDFSWLLEPGEQFQAPEVVLVHSSEGLGGMSRSFHDLYRNRLTRGKFRDQSRPILINNWEATYFDFTADKIEAIAKAGQELGLELFVLDDGWFGKRDNDRSSLGDWFVDRRKLPNGLEDLVDRVRNLDMQFGLWFEPEMISPESELYRAHPDWCLHVEGRTRTTARQQLVLDLSRADVRNYIVETVSAVLASAPITYVKWDMNRNMTEIGSALLPAERQRETAHRYMLGLYDVMERITSAFPDILFESCSGGGGRFDPGMLYYMPQTWTSDNTDAVCRLKIQYGTSIVYPISSMGAHVSAVPNHQVGRSTPLETRGNVALSGNFGYELDLTKFTEDEKTVVKDQVAFYKEVRHLVQFGDFYRLKSPFEGNDTAWMFVSKDKQEALVFFMTVLRQPYHPLNRFTLKGLNPELDYTLQATGESYGGDELMYAGLPFPQFHGDFESKVYRFIAKA